MCDNPALFCGARGMPTGEEAEQLNAHVATAKSSEALGAADDFLWRMMHVPRVLPRLRAEGRKVLLFSQFTRMLDLLEDYLHLRRRVSRAPIWRAQLTRCDRD